MKKYFAILLAVLMSLCAFSALADAALDRDAMVEYDREHNCVVYRIPKEWVLKVEDETILSELTSGEEDGDTFVQAFSPDTEEAEGVGRIAFGPDPENANGTALTEFNVFKGGKLEYVRLILHNQQENNPYITVSEDGKTLTVRLEGNPTTGYEWNCIPDNSGTYELVSEEYVSGSENEMLMGAGGVYTFVIRIHEDPLGSQGSVLFFYERSFEKNSRPMEFDVSFTLGGDGTVTGIESDMMIDHTMED